MTGPGLAILAPLAAGVLTLVLRKGAPGWGLAGSLISAVTACASWASLEPGARVERGLPGLPGLPVRLVETPLTAVIAVMVGVIGALVVIYAVGYMRGAAGQPRFFAELSFFIAAMQTLTYAGDWVLFVAAWELIGCASYLLIGFELRDPRAGVSANRAFITTRGADLALYLGVFALVSSTGTSEIDRTLAATGASATMAGALLLVGAMGKSAQLPFQTWLAAAMVAPTPVSALLHSATLVASGAILLIRISPALSPGVRLVIGVVGGVSALLTGLTAVAERDLKRLLAASTSSQLGFMFLAVGAAAPGAALAHLLSHAAMKSALFQASGVFQRARRTTRFNGLRGVGKAHRRTFLAFVLAGLALAEVPPLVGFWSKDAVIAASFASNWRSVLGVLALLGTLLTGAYVAKAIRLLWEGSGERGPVVGLTWMGAALAGLSAAVLGAGPLLEHLVRRAGLAIPGIELGWSLALGLAAAGLGLWGGSRPLRWGSSAGGEWLREGLPIAGGFDAVIIQPVFALARTADAVEGSLRAGVLGLGRRAEGVARSCAQIDDLGVARGVLLIARTVQEAAAWLRQLQNGLVFRELLFASIGLLVLIAAGAAWNFLS